MIIVFTSILAD